MKKFNYQTGKLGESMAQDFLIKKGYRLVEANFQTRFGEIDLIMAKNKKLIFVEVKLKTGDQFGSPEEMINPAKIRRVQKMATVFLQRHPKISQQYPTCQIDAVCLVLNFDQTISRINHWENIGNEMV